MEKHQEMKKFIAAALEYSKHRADTSFSTLSRQLQLLASSTDVSEFDPVSSVTTEFYVSLHELMSGLESRSIVVWYGIAVLQRACLNPNAKKALIHTYRFIPILTRFLGSQHKSDKQIRLLQVLVELTYGVKISWQEAHLPYLISTLVQVILEGDKEMRPFALAVLVNLCYKNLPALYVLMRKVEITKFIKCITKMNDDPNIRMQVCKMLIILEQMKGVLPETDILNFVDVTFSTVTAAFASKDVFLLRHIVDFFRDVKENEHFKQTMLKYPKYLGDTKHLVELIELQEPIDEVSCECTGVLLDFLPSLLSFHLSGMPKLFPRLAAAALKWVQCESVGISALSVIQTVVEQAKLLSNRDIKDGIVEQLKVGLPGLLVILDSGGDEPPKSLEKRTKLIGLVTLLAEMATYPDLRKEILCHVQYKVIGSLFDSLINQNPAEDNIFQKDVSALCIHVLTLVSTLANFNSDWMSLYTKLLNQRHIQVALAVALYSGSKKMKYQVFTLINTPGCTNDNVNILCDVLCEMKEVSSGPPTSNTTRHETTFQDMVPLYNCVQESRLNELISLLQEARENNRIGDASTSAVMELYEYKLAAMGHAERRLQSSLEAADSCCTGMNHQIAQYRAEVARLHQMLFYSQQCIEGLNVEKKEFVSKLQDTTNQINNQMKTFSQEIKEKSKLLKDVEERLNLKSSELEREQKNTEFVLMEKNKALEQCKTLNTQIEHLTKNLKDSQDSYQDSLKKILELEDLISQSQACINDAECKLKEMRSENKELQHSLGAAATLANHKDQLLHEKNNELKNALMRIEELDRIREIVSNVVSGKKS